jgi:L-asparaginase / beta-aspartyl-peptidase
VFGIVVHGGAGGTSSEAEEGCRLAAEYGMDILQQGGSALDAAIKAVTNMEDSGRFNAGLGSILRIDGTIEMDAAVVDSRGTQGSVGAVGGVKNPVLLALEVARSPHLMLTAEGATAFARERGLDPHPGPTERARQRLEDLKNEVRASLIAGEIPTGWTKADLQKFTGSDGSYSPYLSVPKTHHHDTVGAITLDREGRFALAASTGGSGLMRSGRVGDVPVRGAGYELGPLGVVLATGVGEDIIRNKGSERVYRLLEQEFGPERACREILPFFTSTVVGFIAMTREAVGIATNSQMASHSITEE